MSLEKVIGSMIKVNTKKNEYTEEIDEILSVTWYATREGKGGQFPYPSVFESTGTKLDRYKEESQFIALYDLQPVEQSNESRSLEYRNRMEWWEKEKVK